MGGIIMENKNEKVLDKDLEKVAGGFSGVSGLYGSRMDVSQEEYDCLVDGGYIVDGECRFNYWNLENVSKYLHEKGFEGRICHTGLRRPGVQPDYSVKVYVHENATEKGK